MNDAIFSTNCVLLWSKAFSWHKVGGKDAFVPLPFFYVHTCRQSVIGVKTNPSFHAFRFQFSFKIRRTAKPNFPATSREFVKITTPVFVFGTKATNAECPAVVPEAKQIVVFLFSRTTCQPLPIDVNFPIFVGTNGSCNSLMSICCWTNFSNCFTLACRPRVQWKVSLKRPNSTGFCAIL